jgi:hypothetical protein
MVIHQMLATAIALALYVMVLSPVLKRRRPFREEMEDYLDLLAKIFHRKGNDK